jgi:hypothetical protein
VVTLGVGAVRLDEAGGLCLGAVPLDLAVGYVDGRCLTGLTAPHGLRLVVAARGEVKEPGFAASRDALGVRHLVQPAATPVPIAAVGTIDWVRKSLNGYSYE